MTKLTYELQKVEKLASNGPLENANQLYLSIDSMNYYNVVVMASDYEVADKITQKIIDLIDSRGKTWNQGNNDG